MTMFYECGYPVRISYMIFHIITILSILFLESLLIKWKCEKIRVVIWSIWLAASFLIYVILLDDHISPLGVEYWHRHNLPIPIGVLWVIGITMFIAAAVAILRTNRQYKNTVTEDNIKEALDEVPLAICYFKQDGIPMLCNRRMQEISEIMCGGIFMSYSEFKELLGKKDEWRETGDVFRLPDGTVCRYAEEKIVTLDGEQYTVSNFFDITELARRKAELEKQNEELRKMSATLQNLKENVRLLAKEEEILSIKARWHDVMGEGLTAIRRGLLANQPREVTDTALKRWSDTVNTIQRDNEDPDQRRDALGDLLRDAQGLQIQLIIEGEMPEDKETLKVFILAVRNCLLNAAQHAKATELYIDISRTEKTDILTVSNNGIEPDTEIVPRGGLINVRNHAERIGGKTEIQSVPRFEMKVTIPRKEWSGYDKSACG